MNCAACKLRWRSRRRRAPRASAWLKELSKRIESYQQVNVRMGEALQDLGKQLAPLPDRVARLEQRDPTTLSFSQAARLVGLGASAEDLTQACGLSQAEAELVARLHEAKGK